MLYPIRAYVVFEDKDHWYLRWLPEGFRHVAVVLEFEDYTFLAVNHSWGHTEVGLTQVGYNELLRTGYAVVRCKKPTNSRIIRAPNFTCVQMCKALLGIDKWWVQTPYQLYKEVRRERFS